MHIASFSKELWVGCSPYTLTDETEEDMQVDTLIAVILQAYALYPSKSVQKEAWEKGWREG